MIDHTVAHNLSVQNFKASPIPVVCCDTSEKFTASMVAQRSNCDALCLIARGTPAKDSPARKTSTSIFVACTASLPQAMRRSFDKSPLMPLLVLI
jgi:hypothetical protein